MEIEINVTDDFLTDVELVNYVPDSAENPTVICEMEYSMALDYNLQLELDPSWIEIRVDGKAVEITDEQEAKILESHYEAIEEQWTNEQLAARYDYEMDCKHRIQRGW